jgi:arsenate reductase (glutaredoxin)
MSRLTVYHYEKCSTCRRALAWLRERGIDFREKPIKETPPTPAELEAVLAAQGGEWRRLFNTSGMEYRARGLAGQLPGMDESARIALLAGNGMLVRRPLVVGPGGIGLAGFKEAEWARVLAGREARPSR